MMPTATGGTLGSSHLPLRDVVATELRRQILDGTLRQGERLIEDRLAEQLGVSRNPIREALRMLEAEGFLDVTARRQGKSLGMSSMRERARSLGLVRFMPGTIGGT